MFTDDSKMNKKTTFTYILYWNVLVLTEEEKNNMHRKVF